jgi:SAM-dependent methyltransferase
MGPGTRSLFGDVKIPAGSSCLDMGCGAGDVTFELARAVGPEGRVVGVDLDQTLLDMARRDGRSQNLSNVVFEACDVRTWKPVDLFDFVYARFLLTHLPDPGALVLAVRQFLRPGGVFIVEDIDFRGHFAEPECHALARSVEFYTKVVQNRGADPHIGPRLPGLLRKAGFEEIRMKMVHPAALQGGVKLLICVTLEKIADAVLEDRLATKEELRETIDQLYAFARDPHTVLGGPRVFQTWGRY